jgi:nucleotide-binding universal stress UspA family protein
MVSITRILCPVDFSDCSRLALQYAVAMGKWYGAGVTAVHAFENRPVIDAVPLHRGQPVVLKDLDPAAVRTNLTEFVEHAVGDAPVDIELVEGRDVCDEMLRTAGRIGADVIVMGTHGRSGLQHLLLGSVAEKIVRNASRPVLLVPPAAAQDGSPLDVPFTRIVCAVDFAGESRQAFRLALELAEEADAHLTLVHAIEVPPELQECVTGSEIDVPMVRAAADAAARQQLRDMVPADARTYCKIHTDVRQGQASRAILQAAREHSATLIVMGVHGGNVFDRLIFGSNTHAVLRGARRPVLAVRAVPAKRQTAVA